MLDWVGKDFEAFHDNYKVTTPGFDNPPSNILDGSGAIDPFKAVYAATAIFGAADCSGTDVSVGEFELGYWLCVATTTMAG